MPITAHTGLNGKDHDTHQQEVFSSRSETVQEIISTEPGFLERWGLILFLCFLLLIIVCCWFIKYPDTINTYATLSAVNAPRELVAKGEGKIIKILAANEDTVIEGQMIAWLESTANHQEVIALANALQKGSEMLEKQDTRTIIGLFSKNYFNLGELQSGYQDFITALQQFNDYYNNGFYARKVDKLQRDLRILNNLKLALEKEKDLSLQEVQVQSEVFNMNDSLYRDKVISKQEIRNQKSAFLSKQKTIPQIESALLSNESDQNNKLTELDELHHNIAQQLIKFNQSLLTLKSSTDNWLKRYIISAPVEGKVVFNMHLQENQHVIAGKVIGYVNPGKSEYYAQLNLPQYNLGKIDTGQKVQLRFDAYPYQEFGFVEGRLQYIYRIPTDSGFLADIALIQGLTTNYRKNIQFRNGLKANALVITKDIRLLERFYFQITKAINR